MSDSDLIARIDERVSFLVDDVREIKCSLDKLREDTADENKALSARVDSLEKMVAELRGKWSVVIVGLSALISIATFLTEKVVAPMLGIK